MKNKYLKDFLTFLVVVIGLACGYIFTQTLFIITQ